MRIEDVKIGGYTIMQFWFKSRHKNAVWITNDEGEGMEANGDLIPKELTAEWMHEFWKQNF